MGGRSIERPTFVRSPTACAEGLREHDAYVTVANASASTWGGACLTQLRAYAPASGVDTAKLGAQALRQTRATTHAGVRHMDR
jgi:hypothetical protein